MLHLLRIGREAGTCLGEGSKGQEVATMLGVTFTFEMGAPANAMKATASKVVSGGGNIAGTTDAAMEIMDEVTEVPIVVDGVAMAVKQATSRIREPLGEASNAYNGKTSKRARPKVMNVR